MHFDANARSIAKAVSWRVLGTIFTAAFVLIATGNLSVAALAGGLDVVGKIAAFYVHERIWDRIRFGKRELRPAVIWFTGLPGSGKTTVASLVAADLARRGIKVEHLDGHSVRNIFPSTGYTRKERDEHIKRVGYLASRLESHGVTVVASFVSPFEAARTFARGLCQNFIEVHVSTPLEECERRDPKGLYKRARAGEIRDFTGIDSPYEAPASPELRIDTLACEAQAAAEIVVARALRAAKAGRRAAGGTERAVAAA